jgi:hypothetical protein
MGHDEYPLKKLSWFPGTEVGYWNGGKQYISPAEKKATGKHTPPQKTQLGKITA